LICIAASLAVRRLLAGCDVAAADATHGEEGDADPHRSGRDGTGEQDPPGVAKFAPGRIADR
jgi:hypothetical protein